MHGQFSPGSSVDVAWLGENWNARTSTPYKSGWTGAKWTINGASTNAGGTEYLAFYDTSAAQHTIMFTGMDASANVFVQFPEVCSAAYPNVCEIWGSGAPSGSLCSASPNGTTLFGLGSVYHNIAGGTGTTQYLCEVAGAWVAQ
jgi:hypothetical protein